MSDYYVVQVSHLSTPGEEALSALVFANGALGMAESLPFDQPEGEETVFTRLPDRRTVDVYFERCPPPEFFADLAARVPGARARARAESNRDWLAEWKKGFQPFSLAGGCWVVPSWCEPPPECVRPIRIDPGMAFGTGTHETTRLVAEALAELAPPSSLLDVGTGTGILAVMARHLGVARVHATELDADARRVALENFQLNGMADIGLDERQVGDLAESFDVVVANIIDGVLVRIQRPLLARVRPGGWLVVSGIIAEREPDFLNGFELPAGASWTVRRQKGDWLLFAARI